MAICQNIFCQMFEESVCIYQISQWHIQKLWKGVSTGGRSHMQGLGVQPPATEEILIFKSIYIQSNKN